MDSRKLSHNKSRHKDIFTVNGRCSVVGGGGVCVDQTETSTVKFLSAFERSPHRQHEYVENLVINVAEWVEKESFQRSTSRAGSTFATVFIIFHSQQDSEKRGSRSQTS